MKYLYKILIGNTKLEDFQLKAKVNKLNNVPYAFTFDRPHCCTLCQAVRRKHIIRRMINAVRSVDQVCG